MPLETNSIIDSNSQILSRLDLRPLGPNLTLLFEKQNTHPKFDIMKILPYDQNKAPQELGLLVQLQKNLLGLKDQLMFRWWTCSDILLTHSNLTTILGLGLIKYSLHVGTWSWIDVHFHIPRFWNLGKGDFWNQCLYSWVLTKVANYLIPSSCKLKLNWA